MPPANSNGATGGSSSVEGTLEFAYGHDGEADRYSLRQGNRSVPLAFKGPGARKNRQAVKAGAGKAAKLRVVKRGDGLAVRGVQLAPGVRAAGNGFGSIGAERVAVMLINFDDSYEQPVPHSFIREQMFDGPRSVAAYYREVSNNKLFLTGDVLGWYSIKRTNPNWGGDPCAPPHWWEQARAKRPGGYDAYIYAVASDGASCGFAGAFMNGNETMVSVWNRPDFGNIPGPYGDSFAPGIVAHEMGHNLGLAHAYTGRCVEGIAWSSTNPDCRTFEEVAATGGDPFDAMGISWRARQFIGWRKEFLGWTTVPKQDVGFGGTYTIGAAGFGTGHPEALRIPRNLYTQHEYQLEYRRPTGVFDNYSPTDPVVNGVSMRIMGSPAHPGETIMIDQTAQTDSLDSPLGPGKRFTVPEIGRQIEVLSANGTTASVRVSAYNTAAVTRSGSTLDVRATPGIHNRITVTRGSSDLRITDTTGPLTAPTGCKTVPFKNYIVECPNSLVNTIRIFGQDGNDKLLVKESSGAIKYELDGGPGKDQLDGGAAIDTLRGGEGNDTLRAMGGNDVLSGDAGKDTLKGAAGNDLIDGGAGNDTLDGGPDNDVVSYASRVAIAGVGFVVDLTRRLATQGSERDKVKRFESVIGSAGNDTLTGDALSNTLHGLGGADKLTGGAGSDGLIGDAGNDVLEARDWTADIVNCGADHDTGSADAGDAKVGCEF